MTGVVNIFQAPTGNSLDIRVEVNPNSYHGSDGDPELYIARFRDASAVPTINDEVTVIQPDDDPTADFVSTAVVLDVDQEHRLITLRVDWKGFHDVEPLHRPVVAGGEITVNYREAVLIRA
ncbi:hypothetical protein [Mycobacterium sp.]|uniref:hypothetical protein n=1 Tax=Mycobacterium sp. TaxID=1785 RepID=UPI0031CDFBBF